MTTSLTTKPRWDKYDGYIGNFRAPFAADTTTDQANLVLGVGLNSSGGIVPGAGQTGIVGLIIIPVGNDYITGSLLPGPQAGDVQDVGKHGEITNFVLTDIDTGKFKVSATAPVAGTNYYAHADGTVDATQGDDGVYVGHTVEKDRLIVNVVELASVPAPVTP